MKSIKSKKLKVGDWVRTGTIYDFLTKKGELGGRYYVINIKKTEMGKDGKRNIYIKDWAIYGDEIHKITSLEKADLKELFLMNKKEVIYFKKRLILENLNENKKNRI